MSMAFLSLPNCRHSELISNHRIFRNAYNLKWMRVFISKEQCPECCIEIQQRKGPPNDQVHESPYLNTVRMSRFDSDQADINSVTVTCL